MIARRANCQRGAPLSVSPRGASLLLSGTLSGHFHPDRFGQDDLAVHCDLFESGHELVSLSFVIRGNHDSPGVWTAEVKVECNDRGLRLVER
jgi:hypothetical protein